MPRFFRKRSQKVGLLPGSLVHVGTASARPSRISVLDYSENSLEEKQAVSPA
ncbi:MAG: magnesium and cobalt transport protein CorA, partial [Candidatus Diapherotrites archaeon]|nr:magnesium and cobalt transport protein CorA [Candidatus Diapherotrites archaeon]